MNSVCDADSSELIEAATCLFYNSNKFKSPIKSRIIDHDITNAGNFMYLKSFDIYDPPSRHRGLSYVMLRALFSRVAKYNCSICAFLCLPWKTGRHPDGDSEYVDRCEDENLNATISQKIARHFARIGFLQAKGTSYMFLEISRLPETLLTIPAESVVFVQRITIEPTLNEHNQRLVSLIKNNKTIDAATLRPLIAEGACLDQSCALHIAGANRYVSTMRLLILFGANINQLDFNGYTPLMICCSVGSIDCIQCLLDAKADVNVLDRDGKAAVTHLKKYLIHINNFRLTFNMTCIIKSVKKEARQLEHFIEIMKSRMTIDYETSSEDEEEEDEEEDDNYEEEDDEKDEEGDGGRRYHVRQRTN
eukprot:CAMPEP_0170083280 /NCGR_PEP_ID=MMETSP0019_2-20121128/18669_1 /TAXON_ID=98059 /ORGANISM="Dinobryon sp., Strain UTEXLB2267" /LENGTH=362 /DNA_ID=CAMNT_0010298595 /DNA_START=208 /DNA_END=1296 /DNA_ORIENTATION=+